MSSLSLIDRAFADAWTPPDPQPVSQWCAENVWLDRMSQSGGRWNPDYAPWVLASLQAIADPSIRTIAFSGPAQGAAKSQTFLAGLAWLLAHQPAPTIWVGATDSSVAKFSKDRLLETLRNCTGLRDKWTENRFDKAIYEIRLTSCTLYIGSSNASADLHSTPAAYIFADEVGSDEFSPSALPKLAKRIRTFSRMSKFCLFSSPGNAGDYFDQILSAGSKCVWVVPCQQCGFNQTLVWKQLKYSEKPIRYECEKCGHGHFDVPEVRRHFAVNGRWQSTNPDANPEVVSFSMNAILPPWIPWSDLRDEWKRANELYKQLGNVDALQTFVRESLGEPWIEGQQIEKPDFTTGNYSAASVEGQGDFRGMAVDYQGLSPNFWIAIRDFWKGGRSRLVFEGSAATWGEVWEISQRYKIPNPAWVFVDSGFDASTVYAKCVEFGFTAVKGEDKKYFVHKVNGQAVRRLYGEVQRGDPSLGKAGQGQKFAPLILFSTDRIKDILDWLRRGDGPPWEIPADVSEDYRKHMTCEGRVAVRNKDTGNPEYKWKPIHGRENHLWDCEVILTLFAVLVEVLYETAALENQPVESAA